MLPFVYAQGKLAQHDNIRFSGYGDSRKVQTIKFESAFPNHRVCHPEPGEGLFIELDKADFYNVIYN